ncbi:rhomboid family intramembrane serine protease [Neolewinella antarctica]|uniref:Membrane associated rhomboid family serine protease n=1 Tax=Neolewinella antarctica TaxID=442734 RepID=A0ABX0XGW1_9BACT|nr:rhomboid family intramembrane serine protease [Neolewinella antarctica]NJC27992.1 membrane associated rhomboid family serine protease [Neolewinella antarctica]
MLQSIWDDVRREFNFGNMINKIIIVNVGIWIVLALTNVIFNIVNGFATSPAFDGVMRFFAVTYDPWHLITHPWTLVTHMFVHLGFFHILWNMLFLLYFGRIFGDLYGDKRVLPLYIAGGLFAFVFSFVIIYPSSLGDNISLAYGASGAVACILTTIGVLQPEHSIRLMFLGNVRLKYIVMVTILIQVLSLGTLDNIGGTIDHIGGIVFGIIYAIQLRKGIDLAAPVGRAISWVENTWDRIITPSKDHKQSGPRTTYRRGSSVKETAPKSRPSFMRKAGGSEKKSTRQGGDAGLPDNGMSHQEQLDSILDKIKEGGYNSLNKEEKDFLLRASNQ